MSKVQSRLIVSLVGVAALLVRAVLVLGQEAAQPTAVEQPPAFGEVHTIFAAKCLACHGNDPKELKGDYDLRTREVAIKGGESGDAAIVPGEPDKAEMQFRSIVERQQGGGSTPRTYRGHVGGR